MPDTFSDIETRRNRAGDNAAVAESCIVHAHAWPAGQATREVTMSQSETHPTAGLRHISRSEVDERLGALVGNAAAVAAVASAVEGTLGPKGLNCMLVDRFGDVTITNDGVTILEKMEVSHPAARLVIEAARTQDREVGDGTTTATILASAMIAAGVERIRQGVPVTKVLEGLRAGIATARRALLELATPVSGPHDPLVRQAALIAARQDGHIADLVLEAARQVPSSRLVDDPAFRLADCVLAREGAASQVVNGIIVDKEPMNQQMPACVSPAGVILLDDALEPETMEEEALATEAGFQRYRELQADFGQQVGKLVAVGAGAVFVRRGVAETAEQVLTEAGVMVVRRVLASDLARLAAHTGARVIKRSALQRSEAELKQCLGQAQEVRHDRRLGQVLVTGGAGEPAATVLVGAATRETREEQERIARDAAAAVQAALRGGVLPGGGAAELAAMRAVQQVRTSVSTMAAHGVDCVAEALRRPMSQIVANAGFNPLEKVEAAVAAQAREDAACYGLDCDTGQVIDMHAAGVVDPAPVKLHALTAAGEIAEAILRINIVIRKKDQGGPGDTRPGEGPRT